MKNIINLLTIYIDYMIQICVQFPDEHMIEIDNLVKNHEFDSRSSLVRKAVKDFLDNRKIKY